MTLWRLFFSLICLVMLANVSPARAEDPKGESPAVKPTDSPADVDHAGRFPYLGESLLYWNGQLTNQAKFSTVGLDVSLDTNPYVNPRVFVEYNRARFHRLDLGIGYDISEVWFGGGVKIDLLGGWLSLSPMVGTIWYVAPDDHLNPKLYPFDAKYNDNTQGILLRGIVTVEHPEKYFRVDLEANFDDDVHNHKRREEYVARLAVPVFKADWFVLEVGLRATYFIDRDLRYEAVDVGPFVGPRFLLGKTGAIGIDLALNYSHERNHLIKGGESEDGVSITVTVFAAHF